MNRSFSLKLLYTSGHSLGNKFHGLEVAVCELKPITVAATKACLVYDYDIAPELLGYK